MEAAPSASNPAEVKTCFINLLYSATTAPLGENATAKWLWLYGSRFVMSNRNPHESFKLFSKLFFAVGSIPTFPIHEEQFSACEQTLGRTFERESVWHF